MGDKLKHLTFVHVRDEPFVARVYYVQIILEKQNIKNIWRQ